MHFHSRSFFLIAIGLTPWLAGLLAGESRLPDASLNPRLTAPIATWDEAIPLGNGLMGGLLWGETNLIRLSLDRGDLWDERPAPGDPLGSFTYAELTRLVAATNNAGIARIADAQGYDQKHPTKIPAGRLELALAPGQQVEAFELNLATAEGWAWLTNGTRLEAFFAADLAEEHAVYAEGPKRGQKVRHADDLALIRVPGAAPAGLRLLPPASVRQLGYPPPVTGAETDRQWFVQETAQGQRYAVVVGTRRLADATLLAVSILSSRRSPDPLAAAQAKVSRALELGYDGAVAFHRAHWRDFWNESRVVLPQADVLRHYLLVQYFYGAMGSFPIPLQGLWTADAGGLPPWKGDYHHDLNTQMTYMGYQVGGRFESGQGFLQYLWELRPAFQQFARRFFDTPGLNVPGVMTLAGAPLGGWAQYSLSPTAAGWLAHLHYLQWRYQPDRRLLENDGYDDWCTEAGESLAALLRPAPDGRLVLPTSTSPEIFDNSQRAWLQPNSNYDLAILKMLFLSLREFALERGNRGQADRWGRMAEQLGPFHADPDGTLRINATEPLPASHRHFSNLMGIYPFNLITIEGSDRDRTMIRASLRQYDRLGTSAWCGYSFTWMAALRARVGDAEAAARNLDIFVKAFLLRNGFHANGDQTTNGFSTFTYRPFTLEGNFLAAAAVHEMVLQSWSARPGSGEWGPIRIFPAMPWGWHDAAFEDLRTEGGHRVSARRENNATTWLRVTAGRNGAIRIRDNFGGRIPTWNRPGVTHVGDDYEVTLAAGESIEANLHRPETVPPAPADAFQPVKVTRR